MANPFSHIHGETVANPFSHILRETVQPLIDWSQFEEQLTSIDMSIKTARVSLSKHALRFMKENFERKNPVHNPSSFAPELDYEGP